MVRLILGESTRSLDQRYRLSIPPELAETLSADGGECILAKERPGCLSLWNLAQWKSRLDAGIQLVESKIEAGRLEGRVAEVQRLGRLLSTRHRPVQVAGRGRLVVPEGFREFLGVEPGGDAMVVGAAVCVEIWNPEKWSSYVGEEMPAFRELLERLSG
jgi:MraZ protein